MNLQKVKISDLRPAEYNPRADLQPEEKEYQQIIISIEEFGYVDPIIINKDYTIIGGHQRVKVLRDLGYDEIEAVIVDIDKTREKALNIALNKIEGRWDTRKLDKALHELKEMNFDINITGFSDFDLKFNPLDEWDGMPDYKQDDADGIKLVVHFENEDDKQEFSQLIGQKLTESTKYIWFPERTKNKNKEWEYKARE